MKQIQLIAAAILCSGMALQAQPGPANPCQLEMLVPNEFVKQSVDASQIFYEHKRNESTITLAKANHGESIFQMKSVAMERYDGIVSTSEFNGQSIEQVEIGGVDYFLLSWEEPNQDDLATVKIKALTSRCGVLYELTLTSPQKPSEKMAGLFFEMLESSEFLSFVN